MHLTCWHRLCARIKLYEDISEKVKWCNWELLKISMTSTQPATNWWAIMRHWVTYHKRPRAKIKMKMKLETRRFSLSHIFWLDIVRSLLPLIPLSDFHYPPEQKQKRSRLTKKIHRMFEHVKLSTEKLFVRYSKQFTDSSGSVVALHSLSEGVCHKILQKKNIII